LPCKFRRHNGT